jgi:hypothetical protein
MITGQESERLNEGRLGNTGCECRRLVKLDEY